MSRTTFQKQCVLQVLQSMRGKHPTAELVYEEVLKIIPSISRATVYRILNQNVAQKKIGRLQIPNSPACYDDWTDPHQHLVCGSCNCLIDLPPVILPEIVLPQGVSGHTITGVELIFKGLCSECAAKKS